MKDNELGKIKSGCPLCQNKDYQIIHVFNSEDAANHLLIKEQNEQKFLNLKSHIKHIWKSDRCYFCRCSNCLFYYAIPFVSGDSKFYDLIYSDELNYPKWKWEFQQTIDFLKKNIELKDNNDYKVLEIGAGNGAFVKELVYIIKKKNILTLEYAKYGLKEIEKLGIECLPKDILDLNLPKYKKNFNIIFMFQVLEHMDDIEMVFEHLNWLIIKGGLLFIAVPNNLRRELFEKFGFFEDIPPTHLSRWSLGNFKLLSKRFKWEVVGHKIEPVDFKRNIKKYFGFIIKKYFFYRKVNSINIVYIRKFIKAIIYIFLFLYNIRRIYFITRKYFGNAQWVCLRKL